MATTTEQAVELPEDNASRLAIYDALHGGPTEDRRLALTETELFDRVIGRLRVLVPRELHLAGDPSSYLREKLTACAEAGIISIGSLDGDAIIALTGVAPSIRYPDGEIRDYTPGLELARERLDGDNARLRAASFDVRAFIPSAADDPDGEQFQTLLESMREHGFLRQFWIAVGDDGVITDGRARQRAAEMLRLKIPYVTYGNAEREEAAARRRDTPIGRVMVALDANRARIGADVVLAVQEAVAAVTRRPWEMTRADLRLTSAWRLSIPPEYRPQFEVRLLPFRPGAEAKIQVTADGKVMLRSLIEAGGLSNYKIKMITDRVPTERARSGHSAGRKAVFARIDDLISGIPKMQHELRAANRKVDPEWDDIHHWLVTTFADGKESVAP